MRKFSILLLIISFLGAQECFSQLYDGQSLARISLQEVAERTTPGTILLLGEHHGLAAHRDQHLEILELLRNKGLKVSVGLEFVNYTDQAYLTQYRQGLLTEADFLKQIKWGGFNFDYYRPQINFPNLSLGEQSLGLNLPRSITSKISRQGLQSLTEDELALMPPQFALGRDSYKARFMAAAGSHCKVPDNCFAAQCAWDDTMAWQAAEFVQQNPEHVLVIVVGEFHVQFGGGLKHRILQRLNNAKIVTLSQLWTEGMSADEIQQALQPSVEEGARADFIWLSQP